MRTLVHAFREDVRAATLAACTQIEHAVGATDDNLKLMAEKGTYLDPQAGLLWENYLLNAKKLAGTPFFPKTVEEFAPMKNLSPVSQEFLRLAAKIPGLKIVSALTPCRVCTGGTPKSSFTTCAIAEWTQWRR